MDSPEQGDGSKRVQSEVLRAKKAQASVIN